MNARNSNGESDETSNESLRVMQQHLMHLIDLAHDAIIVRDPASTIIFWNQGASSLYGWSEEEALGKISHQLLQTRFPRSREATDKDLEQRGQWEGHLIHTRRDGSQVIVESRQVLVREPGSSNQSTAMLEINRDITERERLQSEQIEAHARELTFQKTKEQMDEFLGIISHELRTPMTTIKGNIQLAKMRLQFAMRSLPADNAALFHTLEEVHMMLERAERQANTQNRLIKDLVDSSRIQSGRLDLQQEQADLSAIVQETLGDLQSAFPGRIIHVSATEGASIPVFVDAERIGEVINNYVTNALKYAPEDRPIEVWLEKKGDRALFSLHDFGPGLSPSEQAHIWDRFYRVEGIKRQRGFAVGMGLGLYICRAIIEQHQGEVGVESDRGEGSTFWFTLPLAKDEQ
ncbi:MAG TPA: ATP-binding protein [Ktedonobacteraceae bacterium]